MSILCSIFQEKYIENTRKRKGKNLTSEELLPVSVFFDVTPFCKHIT